MSFYSSPEKCYGEITVKNCEDAIYNDLPSLVKIKKEMGANKLLIFIMDIILNVVKFFNIGKTMNVEQAKNTAEIIINEYYYLKPSELKYCFNKGKMGVYGKLYDRIDGAVFFDWINQYLEERLEICTNKNRADAGDFKSLDYKKNSLKVLEPILKAIENEKVKEVEIPKPENYDMHQRWMKQWDFCAKWFGVINTNGRFIKRYGKIMDRDAFFNYKLEQLKRITAE